MSRRSDFYLPRPIRWPLQLLTLAVLPIVCPVLFLYLFEVVAAYGHTSLTPFVHQEVLRAGVLFGIVVDLGVLIDLRRSR